MGQVAGMTKISHKTQETARLQKERNTFLYSLEVAMRKIQNTFKYTNTSKILSRFPFVVKM